MKIAKGWNINLIFVSIGFPAICQANDDEPLQYNEISYLMFDYPGV